MKLSSRAIELCRIKFGKGIFYGFEQMDKTVLSSMSEEDAQHDFNELTQNGIVGLIDGNIHISALGHHIFHMMLNPEQYIILDNEANSICVRLYIRNAYYLCVIENKKVEAYDSYDHYTFELLPRLDLVIGAFVYALHVGEKQNSVADGNSWTHTVRAVGKAWNQDKNLVSELIAEGEISQGGTIRCQICEETAGIKKESETFSHEASELINKLTQWMFSNISETYEKEVL